ncbi:hypothetical protein KF840_17075 [bacterium]|nr:hypothetical protein [bacterium]
MIIAHLRSALVAAATALLLPAAAPAACADCDGDGRVTINELITGIAIALGSSELASCPAFDGDGNGTVSIDELIAAIGAALDGCDDATAPTSTPTPTVAPTPAAPPPSDPDGLLRWLQAGSYLDWAAESAPHPSAGPHGGRVRTFLNPELFASLDAGEAQHPAGAAAVKELYFNGDTVRGWAVMVKLQADSDRGRGWYWYETFGSGAPLEGVGLGTCTGCHSAGRDFVRIPFPLQ